MVFITFYCNGKQVDKVKGAGLIPPSVGDKVKIGDISYVTDDRQVEYGGEGNKTFTHFKVKVDVI